MSRTHALSQSATAQADVWVVFHTAIWIPSTLGRKPPTGEEQVASTVIFVHASWRAMEVTPATTALAQAIVASHKLVCCPEASATQITTNVVLIHKEVEMAYRSQVVRVLRSFKCTVVTHTAAPMSCVRFLQLLLLLLLATALMLAAKEFVATNAARRLVPRRQLTQRETPTTSV